MENHCLICYDVIPEGMQVCPRCMRYYMSEPVIIPKEPEKERSITMTKEDIIRKLSSRKFWMAVAEFVTALLIYLKKDASQAEALGALIMLAAAPIAYMFAEGWADAGRSDTQPEAKPPEKIDG